MNWSTLKKVVRVVAIVAVAISVAIVAWWLSQTGPSRAKLDVAYSFEVCSSFLGQQHGLEWDSTAPIESVTQVDDNSGSARGYRLVPMGSGDVDAEVIATGTLWESDNEWRITAYVHSATVTMTFMHGKKEHFKASDQTKPIAGFAVSIVRLRDFSMDL